MVNLTLAVPLRSRHAPEVLRAVSSLLCETSRVGTTHLPAALGQGQRIHWEADERLDPVS